MRQFALVFGLASALILSACASENKTASASAMEYEAQCQAVKPGKIESVNTMCVVVPTHPVDPATKCSEFNGQKIGFCCAGCIGKWEAMTPAQKTSALAKAQAAAKK